MYIRSRIILLTAILSSFSLACSLGSGFWTEKFPEGYASLISAEESGTDNLTLLKPIQLTIDPKSVYRSDIPLDGLYNNSKDLLYNIVASDLLLAGYRVLNQSESKTRVANKLKIKYIEDTADSEWRLSIPDECFTEYCPKARGTRIICEVELKNLTTKVNKKKKIDVSTPKGRFSKLAVFYGDNTNDTHTNADNKNGDNMRRVVYFSAFDDFNKQLIKLIDSVF